MFNRPPAHEIPDSPGRTHRRHHRQPNLALHAGERRARLLWRWEAQEGFEDLHGRRYAGHLLALHVTPASAEDRGEVERLACTVQAVTGDQVEIAYVDQGYTGTRAAAAATHGIALEVVKLPEAKRGFVLLPCRWIVERPFAWATRFRRLVKDYERYAETLAGVHVVAFACL